MRAAALALLCLVVALPATGQSVAPKNAKQAAAKQAATKPAVAGKQGAKTAASAKQAPKAAKQPVVAAGTRKQAIVQKSKTARAGKAKGKAKGVAAAPKVDPGLVATYAAMAVGDRRAIQSDLVWTGDYNGMVGDEFGERAIAAVKSWQASSGAEETGILNARQRSALAAAAKARQDAAGWRVVDDSVTGARIAIPARHAPQSSATASGTRWSSGRGEVQIETFRIAEPATTLAAVFEQHRKEPHRQVEYSVLRDNFFVLSGLQGLKRFYVRGQARGNDVRGVTIMYDQAMQGIMDRVAIAMSSRFEPFPSAAVAPAVRRKVEYATAIVVDDLGHVITDRQVIDGCYVITLAGFGGAERIAESSDIVLLRLYGARNLKPLALAPKGAGASGATLVGIADPQAQAGSGATTTLAVRLDTNEAGRRVVDPPPPLGFSGAAAVDGQGRLVGMAQVKPALVAGPGGAVRGEIVPADDIRAFLEGRNVAPAAAGASSIDARDSVLRVICVRK